MTKKATSEKKSKVTKLPIKVYRVTITGNLLVHDIDNRIDSNTALEALVKDMLQHSLGDCVTEALDRKSKKRLQVTYTGLGLTLQINPAGKVSAKEMTAMVNAKKQSDKNQENPVSAIMEQIGLR